MPRTLAYRLLIFLPVGALCAWNAKKYVNSEDSDGSSKGASFFGKDPGGGAADKSWYQVSRVEDSYSLLGYEFRSPQKIFMTFIRRYMGGVVKEVFADEKVNQEGLNFLTRALEHP